MFLRLRFQIRISGRMCCEERSYYKPIGAFIYLPSLHWAVPTKTVLSKYGKIINLLVYDHDKQIPCNTTSHISYILYANQRDTRIYGSIMLTSTVTLTLSESALHCLRRVSTQSDYALRLASETSRYFQRNNRMLCVTVMNENEIRPLFELLQ